MAIKINWSVSIQVTEGPKISESKSLEVEAVDKIEVSVPAQTTSGATTKDGTASVDLQPGGDGKVQLLVLKSDSYHKGLTYKRPISLSSRTAPPLPRTFRYWSAARRAKWL